MAAGRAAGWLGGGGLGRRRGFDLAFEVVASAALTGIQVRPFGGERPPDRR